MRPQPNGPVREAFDPTALDAERTTDRWAKQAATRSEFDLALDALVSVMHPSELEKYGRRAQAVPSAAAQEWRNRHAGR